MRQGQVLSPAAATAHTSVQQRLLKRWIPTRRMSPFL